MEFLEQLGFLGFGTRLKILSDRIMNEAGKAYEQSGIYFEARWFTTFYLISKSKDPVTISEIANKLNMSHPAIIKITNALLKKDFICSSHGDADKRKRFLTISQKGKEILPKLNPLWKAFSTASKELFTDSGIDMLSVISKFEKALNKRSLTERVISNYQANKSNEIIIIEYSKNLKKDFQDLNKEWIKKYVILNEIDQKILNNPESEIVNKNGMIYFALIDEQVIGTGAIYQISEDTFIISKMAVTQKYQKHGAGTKLLKFMIRFARTNSAETVVLLTEEKLDKAVSLYRKAGFEIASNNYSSLKKLYRGDDTICMSLKLNNSEEK